ncbi:serine hydrolase domain-containing protein [Sphingosinicella rhizophila]|uniref:Serine hydrolase domain-containing protein n=1 Tax=Sphingosinicella rhizophila TaxID=3050082 RepID=A0ABU3Q702_9SPHN|nr:serine hydrolase domain-containing protein [Sphingosinicella sp. GR2756]MDT9599181.1 serine hydrolase domain-containing protein [Sphingosinicella sp. GR2756]
MEIIGAFARQMHAVILFILFSFLVGGAPAHGRPADPPASQAAYQKSPAINPVAPIPSRLDKADVESWLDGFMSLALPRSDIAGATVAIVKDGQVLLTKGYGYADVERRVPVDADRHLFRIASISKLFTWTAVMQQVEKGKIDLDVDINHYLDFRIPPYRGKPLTMRNLMTHTAGFELVMRDLFSARPNGADLGAAVKLWVPSRIYAPGTTPTYSNYGPALAGYILERVSGEAFDDYVDRHILRPLGMSRSTSRQPLPSAFAKDLSEGYMLGSGASHPYEYVSYRPAGGMASTAPDMARFMIAHLNDGALGRNRILQPDTARMMHVIPNPILPPLHAMGLGFYQHDINGRRVLVHDGDTRFFHSQLNLFLDDNVGIFVSLNSSGRDGGADIVRAALFTKFADRYFPSVQVDGRVDPNIAARHARAMVGHYEVSDRSATNFLAVNLFRHPIAIEVDGDGNLIIPAFTGLDGAPKRWREITPWVWREVNGRERLAAQLVDGRPVRFSTDELSPLVVWDRLPWWRSTVWLQPLSKFAFAVLLLTIAAWPASAALRRYSGKPALLPAADRRVYLGLRIAALAGLIVPSIWVGTIAPIMTFTADENTIDFRIIMASLLTLVGYAGGLLLAFANGWMAWRNRGWASRLWSVTLILSFFILAWVAWQYKLLSFSTDF